MQEEIAVLQQAAILYTRYAQDQAARFVRLQRPLLSLDQLVQTIRVHLLTLANRQEPGNTMVSLSAD